MLWKRDYCVRCQTFLLFLCARCLLANLDVCVFIGFYRFILVFPHIIPLLKAIAYQSQLRLSLLKWGEFFFFFKSNFATANKIIATLSGYTIVTLTLTYQLLSLGKISGGCVCSLGSSEPLLYHSGVWCDCWWSYTGSLGMGSAPCWGVLVGTLLAPLSKALQERFYTYIRI